MNRRQSHFESVQRAGGRIAWSKVECDELNTKLIDIATNKMSDFREPDKHTWQLLIYLAILVYKIVEEDAWV